MDIQKLQARRTNDTRHQLLSKLLATMKRYNVTLEELAEHERGLIPDPTIYDLVSKAKTSQVKNGTRQKKETSAKPNESQTSAWSLRNNHG